MVNYFTRIFTEIFRRLSQIFILSAQISDFYLLNQQVKLYGELLYPQIDRDFSADYRRYLFYQRKSAVLNLLNQRVKLYGELLYPLIYRDFSADYRRYLCCQCKSAVLNLLNQRVKLYDNSPLKTLNSSLQSSWYFDFLKNLSNDVFWC